jgi:hypothetical protein
LYDASEELPDSEYFKDRFAYFGSIHPTLIHFFGRRHDLAVAVALVAAINCVERRVVFVFRHVARRMGENGQ